MENLKILDSHAEPEIVLPERIWDKSSKTNDSMHRQLIQALSKQIEIKDMRTASHCKAVRYYSECIGLHYGLPLTVLQVLKDAALLHDIGKIMVDLQILNKRGPLNNREQLQMHSHAEKGMWTLEAFHLNDLIVDAAWHHHEWFNGSGYPDGLKRQDICITTRIITLADAMDAMSASRPYREPFDSTEIMRQLEDGAGKQFDAQLVKITQKLLTEGKMEILG